MEAEDLRRPIIAGNWKMHNTVAAAEELARGVLEAVGDFEEVDVIVAPAFTALDATRRTLAGTAVGVAAQDMYWADQGAFTGAVSPVMIAELAKFVILGHSERRHLFGETDEEVNRKVHAAYSHGLVPIICVGETEPERDDGLTDELVAGQLRAALEGVSDDEARRSVIAYEPVWAIGTGRACDPAEAARVAGLIRQWLADEYGTQVAGEVRVLYGGSVKPGNILSYQEAEDIDGALVGGASLTVDAFSPLVGCAAEVVRSAG
jgi:triosephosphate isomerase